MSVRELVGGLAPIHYLTTKATKYFSLKYACNAIMMRSKANAMISYGIILNHHRLIKTDLPQQQFITIKSEAGIRLSEVETDGFDALELSTSLFSKLSSTEIISLLLVTVTIKSSRLNCLSLNESDEFAILILSRNIEAMQEIN